MARLEYGLTRGKVSTSHALIKPLIVFIVLALVKMDVHPIRAAGLACHIIRKAPTLLAVQGAR
jgi:hypothetical protein